MERYIDAEELMKEIKKCKFEITGCGIMYHAGNVQSAINFAPTADVVPKSEYDAVVSAVDNSTKEFLKLHCDYQKQKAENEILNYILHCYALQYGTVKDKQAVIDKAKAEVAREIFAAIEFDIRNLDFDREETRAIAIEGVIANLKKIYTEGEQYGN